MFIVGLIIGAAIGAVFTCIVSTVSRAGEVEELSELYYNKGWRDCALEILPRNKQEKGNDRKEKTEEG